MHVDKALDVSSVLSNVKSFEFVFKNNRKTKTIVKAKELKNQGDMIVFPSYLWHRVKPVTKGTRKSLVIWFIGPPFV